MKGCFSIFILFSLLFSCHSDLPVENGCRGIKSPLSTDQKAYINIRSHNIVVDYVAPKTGSYIYEWSYAGAYKTSDELQPFLNYLNLDFSQDSVMQITLFYNEVINETENKNFDIADKSGFLIYHIDHTGNVVGVVFDSLGKVLEEFRPKKTSVYRTAYIMYEMIGAPLNDATFVDFYNNDIKKARKYNLLQVNYAQDPCEIERLLVRKVKKFKSNNVQEHNPE